MLKDLKVTLYEIFGYVLPGCLFLLAIATLFWSIFPHVSVPVRGVSTEIIAAIFFASYYFGHVGQALGNALAELMGKTDSSVAEEMSIEIGCLYDVVKQDIVRRLKVNASDLKVVDIVRIADETTVQAGFTGDREVYQYREGFYRGLSVACIVLTIAFVVRIIAGSPSVQYNGVAYEVTMNMLIFYITITCSGTVLFYYRYIRFAKYRVRHGLLSYLVFTSIKKSAKGEEVN